MSATIFAKASGSGRSGVAVYRISGPEAGRVLSTLTGSTGKPRAARRVTVRDGDGAQVDDGLALWFPGPASFTGEDVAELQLHGSIAVERRLTEVLTGLGIEPAGPGAFSMRAFANGKMDLTQAEGLSDLLEAETELQLKQALAGHSGQLRALADEWRGLLISALAQLEAAVDFPDEEDVPAQIAERALPLVRDVRTALSDQLATAARARRVAEGVTIAILGPPNAGKSSLFNRLVADERAIVSPEEGTTRDVVSERVELHGHLVSFLDTAGVREDPSSSVEATGIGLAVRAAEQADLRLLCYPSGAGDLPGWLQSYRRDGDIIVRTKSDLSGELDGYSSLDDQSVERLSLQIRARLDDLAAPGLAASERQAGLIRAALVSLDGFEASIEAAPELGSETIRHAATRLEELTGRIAPDDVLGDIFSSFCIGK
ncbi:tRNA uridine-5-carboxymethylaminomethyl(34) synthesis GTPase MnmE [Parvularcula sp. ZS-1/3]|uniref:tRNA modification GTPase MnmE n=1 Tax=Parvularcula mediterranea TaxID=2732508 RepID=A0A7Y3W4Q9_9PROT|nr:tRNA uridine-5-carboxymethylaminomethyl(34) synthesis GTPase MnmE [Parvularcula mediterranea]NNU15728.1 tRNA uridine-5-carboxymethylaminomethyl(34) synthesis GTPase MnmE [Parvularcula mediterranea]